MTGELSYRKFTSKAEADKAINSLKGILLGIGFDKVVSPHEIIELENWCGLHEALIERNPFKEFMTLIQESIKNNSLDIDTIQDLYWLCQKYENDSIYYNGLTSDIQLLQGICHGIIADGIITDSEIFELDKWVAENTHLKGYYPYDELDSLLMSILKDKNVSENERKQLMAFFNEFTAIRDKNTEQIIRQNIADITISGICTVTPEISFNNKVFCFTGISQRAPRTELAKTVEYLGGKFINSISSKTNYLVIGDNGNPCWTYACYGRKVESAMTLRKTGVPILIIHENDFWDSAEDAKA